MRLPRDPPSRSSRTTPPHMLVVMDDIDLDRAVVDSGAEHRADVA
jgi:hypothetical protein